MNKQACRTQRIRLLRVCSVSMRQSNAQNAQWYTSIDVYCPVAIAANLVSSRVH